MNFSLVVIPFNSRICIVLFHNICFLLESVCFHFFILSMFFKYDFLYFFDVFRITTFRSFVWCIHCVQRQFLLTAFFFGLGNTLLFL